jgi:GNAT superfamily N-acetyltransferase
VDVAVESLRPPLAGSDLARLVVVLRDAVDGGASVGFLPPLSDADAVRYWESVVADVRDGARVLLVARTADAAIVGTAQLALDIYPNGRHRAEVMKVMVLGAERRRGIGTLLMRTIEDHARALGRTTLVLATRAGDDPERLYRTLGYRCAGVIPDDTRDAQGAFRSTAIYYRLLHRAEGGLPA